jgi:hypothetical protein
LWDSLGGDGGGGGDDGGGGGGGMSQMCGEQNVVFRVHTKFVLHTNVTHTRNDYIYFTDGTTRTNKATDMISSYTFSCSTGYTNCNSTKRCTNFTNLYLDLSRFANTIRVTPDGRYVSALDVIREVLTINRRR